MQHKKMHRRAGFMLYGRQEAHHVCLHYNTGFIWKSCANTTENSSNANVDIMMMNCVGHRNEIKLYEIIWIWLVLDGNMEWADKNVLEFYFCEMDLTKN